MTESQIEWAVIYGDRSVFTNLDGSWEEAPAWGVQAIIYRSAETGWSIATAEDYFIRLPDGEFLPINENALQDYVANVWKLAKVGRRIGNHEYAQIHGLALELMGDVKKTGYLKRERRVSDGTS